MDTILYFYNKNEKLRRPVVEAISQETFMLVKIGMDVEPFRWFIQLMPNKKTKPEMLEETNIKLKGWDWFNPKYHKERRQIKIWESNWRSYEATMDSLMVRCSMHVETLIRTMIRELIPYVDEYSECYCIYENSVRDVLLGDNPVGKVWRSIWKVKEFSLYTEMPWVQYLTSMAVLNHFVILGHSSCIPELLTECADRMKSLRWILEESYARAHSEELEDFAENFYQEYGLAISMEYVQGENGFNKMQLVCKEPSNILDFSEEDKISNESVAEGSLWLDMHSSEEKCQSLAWRNPDVEYLSLRKKWHDTQKKNNYLDTLDKNEYNT